MDSNPSDFENLRSRLQLDRQGTLTLNGQAMILLPRHFFRYILREVASAAGPEVFRAIFHKAGHDGAMTFCRRFQEVHRCSAREALEGYFREMSLRGWGHFAIERLDLEACTMEVSLRDSAVAGGEDYPCGNIIWEGAIWGAMTFLCESAGQGNPLPLRVAGREIAADRSGNRTYRIVVSPLSREGR